MKYLLCLLCALLSMTSYAQTAAEAKALYDKGEYEKAKPAYKKLVKAQPGNGNYNLYYGVCCLNTGEADEAVKYLQTAVKRRIASGQYHLARAYNQVYRFEDAVQTCEDYIADLKKRKRSTEQAEALLEKSKTNLRMLKGVEEVCFIDSFVVDKADFLSAYKISEESGKLFMYDAYFTGSHNEGGTVYMTELGNKLYFSEMQPDSTLGIVQSNKHLNAWSDGTPLPDNINGGRNADYPYVMSDGVTIYFAADGENSVGGYDIFVTRYNTNNNSYLTPENVGMPFNSPYNDYMYVIDEFNNLGWFASDRYQPEGKVCIYVFVPNSSKQVYDYENMDAGQLVSLAQLRSIRATWIDNESVEAAQERLLAAREARPRSAAKQYDFQFVIDDDRTYTQLSHFKSPQAQALFREYRQQERNCQEMQADLDGMRESYARADRRGKVALTSNIIRLEQRIRKLSAQIERTAIEIRRLEITHS